MAFGIFGRLVAQLRIDRGGGGAQPGRWGRSGADEPVQQTGEGIGEFLRLDLTRCQGRKVKLTKAGQRLAQLAHAHLSGLEDFQKECRGVPQTLSLGSGNSLIEWVVMPRMVKLRRSLPNTLFEFYGGRTEDLVRQLGYMNLVLASVDKRAVARPLKFKRLFVLTYSLFVPKRLTASIREDNLKAAMAVVPLATSVGGQFPRATDDCRRRVRLAVTD
jgi:DNA-binding transcriptional LysR family regulator